MLFRDKKRWGVAGQNTGWVPTARMTISTETRVMAERKSKGTNCDSKVIKEKSITQGKE